MLIADMLQLTGCEFTKVEEYRGVLFYVAKEPKGGWSSSWLAVFGNVYDGKDNGYVYYFATHRHLLIEKVDEMHELDDA